jgi:hypothetical protein
MSYLDTTFTRVVDIVVGVLRTQQVGFMTKRSFCGSWIDLSYIIVVAWFFFRRGMDLASVIISHSRTYTKVRNNRLGGLKTEKYLLYYSLTRYRLYYSRYLIDLTLPHRGGSSTLLTWVC